ncbi:hypothetical protein [Pseudorhodoferax sp.]|uniref:hypothetical protein n=1 Tax=Pseudorhodoferax sp. TaxID=1993553 RepID=UPI0039E69880
MCFGAARRAGIEVPMCELSEDGPMLVLDRFDLVAHEDGRVGRLGLEDIAARAGDWACATSCPTDVPGQRPANRGAAASVASARR